MLEVKLEYIEFVKCSVCGKGDEGIDIDINYGEVGCSVGILASICESCWTKWFKKFQREK
jgi:Fe-S cluster biosynthesis and repair protein YggX